MASAAREERMESAAQRGAARSAALTARSAAGACGAPEAQRLAFFEVEIDDKGGAPHRVQVVLHNLCAPGRHGSAPRRCMNASAHAPQRPERPLQRSPRHPPSASTEVRCGAWHDVRAEGRAWRRLARAHIRLFCATLPNAPVLPIATHGCSGPPVRTCRKATGSDLPIRSRSAKLRCVARQPQGARAHLPRALLQRAL